MNKRIEAMAEMAGWWQPNGLPSDWGNESDYVVSQEQMKKFAELIVRECVEVVNELADPDCSESYVWAIQNATEQIKLHFGLKE